MDVHVDVIGQKLRIPTNEKRFASGTNRFVRFVFHMADDWKTLVNTATFEQDGNTYPVPLDENYSVFLPSEITNGFFSLTLYGAGIDVSAKSFPIVFTMGEDVYTHSNNNSNNQQINTGCDIATLSEVKAYLGI